MTYRVQFTKGMLAGREFPLSSATTVIGRSRSADIVVPVPDVSARHVVIETSDSGITLVNLSRHHTSVGLKEIPENNRVSLPTGIPVGLGRHVEFQVLPVQSAMPSEIVRPGNGDAMHVPESGERTRAPAADGQTRLPGVCAQARVPAADGRTRLPGAGAKTRVPPADGRVQAPAAGSVPPVALPKDDSDLGATQFLQTQLVSPEEIEKLIASGKKRRSRRVFMKVFLFVGLFLGVAGVYYAVQVHQRPEKSLSWPLTASGKYDIRTVDLPTPFGPDAFWVECPGSPQFQIKSGKDGNMEILTRIGKKRDVEFRIVFRCVQSADNLRRNRRQHFDKWRREREEQDGWNFQSISPPAFLENNSGFPYFDVQYLRTEKTASDSVQWFGHALFAVHADCVLTLSREIPAVEQWRGATIVAVEKLLRVGSKEIDGHWEGRPDARDASVKDLRDEAAGLLARKSPILWQETEFLIQSALIKCGGHGEDTERLLAMLRELRANQKHEYRQLKVAWHQANRVRDKIGSQRVLENALKVFSSPDDRRNWLLKKGEW